MKASKLIERFTRHAEWNAQILAAAGYHVFPIGLRPGHKTPQGWKLKKVYYKGLTWATMASSDPEQVAAMFAEHPGSAVGVATGPSRIAVADDDDPERVELIPDLPDTFGYQTARGGSHRWYAVPEGKRIKSHPMTDAAGEPIPDADIKSWGGMVVFYGMWKLDPADVPRPAKLPLLPERWHVFADDQSTAKASDDDVEAWLSAERDAEPDERTRRKMDRAIDDRRAGATDQSLREHLLRVMGAAHRSAQGRRWTLDTFEARWFDGHPNGDRKKYWRHDVPGVLAKIKDDPVAPPPLTPFVEPKRKEKPKAKREKRPEKRERVQHEEYEPSGRIGETMSTGRPREVAQDLLDRQALPPLAYREEQWYAYRDGHYSPVVADTIFDLVAAALDGAYYQIGQGKTEDWKPSPGKVSAVVRMLQGLCVTEAPLSGAWLDGRDAPTHLVPCRDGLLDPKTREVHPRSFRFFSTRYLNAEMRGKPKRSKLWDAFLSALWSDDADSVALLQEWLGYVISGDTWREKGMLVVGPPRAGKGTLLAVAEGLVGGPIGATSTSTSRMATNFGLMGLPGKSLLTIGDMRGESRDAARAANLLLEMIGGDTVSIDRKNKAPIDGKITARVMVGTNIVPTLYDDAAAIETRFLILRVTESALGHENPDYKELLPKEPNLGAIAHWALEGYARLQRRGRFTVPAADAEDRREMRHNANPALAFVEAACEIITGDEIGSTSSEVCAAYERWSREEFGIGQAPMRTPHLLKAIAGAGLGAKTQVRSGDSRERRYKKLRVLPRYSDAEHAKAIYGDRPDGAIVTDITQARR